jgi:FKBP-type peptidyl-prolyl cis-trans isomerase
MTNDLFIFATRNKLRFASIRGELSVEQLWDVPLRSRDDFNLNTVAKTANKALKEISEESFVETTKTAAHTRCEAAMETVKYIIDVKLAEEEAAKNKATKKQEKEKLLAILAEKQDGKLSELSEKELQKRIAALDD